MDNAKPMQGLSAWLRCEADRHAVSIAFRDPAVQQHIVTLRIWAREVDEARAVIEVAEKDEVKT